MRIFFKIDFWYGAHNSLFAHCIFSNRLQYKRFIGRQFYMFQGLCARERRCMPHVRLFIVNIYPFVQIVSSCLLYCSKYEIISAIWTHVCMRAQKGRKRADLVKRLWMNSPRPTYAREWIGGTVKYFKRVRYGEVNNK